MKQYLYSAKFLKDYRKVFKKGQIIEFQSGMNILAGDQGTGKSSFLSLFRKENDRLNKETIEYTCDIVTSLGFDTEKDNPRTLSYFKEGSMKFQVEAMYSSHGQAIMAIMKGIKEAKDKLVFVDEPESGLSIRSQYKLVEYFEEAIKNGCQVIVASHSVILMEAFGSVFNLEKMAWMDSSEYIDSCK